MKPDNAFQFRHDVRPKRCKTCGRHLPGSRAWSPVVHRDGERTRTLFSIHPELCVCSAHRTHEKEDAVLDTIATPACGAD